MLTPRKNWLISTVSKLKVWNDAKLRVIDKIDLLKLIKVAVWIPGNQEDVGKVCKRLNSYNLKKI